MSQLTPERQSQEQSNLVKDNNISGSLHFAPVQIETQIIQISVEKITQQPLNKSSPYRGLNKFDFKDRDRFFGRDKLITRLFEAVNKSGLSLVLGASGSGKSSVVRAGLIPELKKSLESKTFYDFIFTPNQDPFDSLYRCLLNEEKDYSFSKSKAEIALGAKVDTLTRVISTLKKEGERWLIFVDQFEELFTICDDADKCKNFIKGLVQVATSGNSSVQIVLAMRSDFLEKLSSYPDLGAIANQNNIHLVTEMYADELRQAIEQPAARHGVVFEEGLVEEIIKDVQSQAGYLPLLQYTLDLLWREDGGLRDRTLNTETYRRLGGVRGTLQKRVDEIYQDLSKQEQQAAQRIFLKIVEIGGDKTSETDWKPVRRRALRSEFSDELEQTVLVKLINENLLVSDRQPQSQESTVEITHEILLTSWTTLKTWIQENRHAVALRNRLNDDVSSWQAKKTDDELWSGSKLEKVLELGKDQTFNQVLGGFNPEVNQFIDASVEWRDRQEKERKAQERKQELSLAGSLGRSALSLLDKGKELEAVVEAIKAGKILQKYNESNPEVLNALQESLKGRSECNRLEEHSNSVNSVSFSPDGKILASGSSDETIRLWNLERGKEGEVIHTFKGHKGQVNSVSFSPDGKILASGSADETIRLWNLESGREGEVLHTFTGHGNYVNSVSFSPDGKILASGSADETIRLWNLESGREGEVLHTFTGHGNYVNSVSFSPDGKILASGSADKTIRLWNLERGKESEVLYTFEGHGDYVNSISFSSDGKTLVSGSADNTVKLWNVKTRKEIHTFEGHIGEVSSVSFSLDNKMLASGSADNMIKLWNVKTRKEICTLHGHNHSVKSISFSPDEKALTLASGSADKRIKLWNIEGGNEIRTLKGHSSRVNSISFSPGEKISILASGSAKNTIKLWNVEEGNEIDTPYLRHGNYVNSVSFSPNGKILTSGSDDYTIQLWNVEDVTNIHTLKTLHEHKGQVNSVGFSPDGKILASGSADHTIKLWNVEDVTKIRILKTLCGHKGPVNSISFSPDRKILASGSADHTIKLWNVADATKIRTLKTLHEHKGPVNSISFSPDGKTLASGSADHTIKLWNVADATKIRTLKIFCGTLHGHDSYVNSVSFSFNSEILASGSADNTIKLWNVKTLKEIHTLQGHAPWVQSVSFSPDKKILASGGADNMIKLWDLDFWTLDSDSLIKLACDRTRAYLQNSPNISESDRHLCDSEKYCPQLPGIWS
jgi:WD40 repeat protein